MKSCSKCLIVKDFSEFYVVNTKTSLLRPACKACTNLASKKYNKTNSATVNKYKVLWAKSNPDKVKESYFKRDKSKMRFYSAKRRTSKLRATPLWLTQEQIMEMKRIYDSCPPGYHVDHIVPLQGKSVRGLHVPWNLQYLTYSENVTKGNRL